MQLPAHTKWKLKARVQAVGVPGPDPTEAGQAVEEKRRYMRMKVFIP